MNFDFWKEELSIYPDECTSVDEQEVLMIWPYGKSSDNTFGLLIDPDYVLEKVPEEEAEGQQMYRVVPKEK